MQWTRFATLYTSLGSFERWSDQWSDQGIPTMDKRILEWMERQVLIFPLKDSSGHFNLCQILWDQKIEVLH
jgi:hypothetical protein